MTCPSPAPVPIHGHAAHRIPQAVVLVPLGGVAADPDERLTTHCLPQQAMFLGEHERRQGPPEAYWGQDVVIIRKHDVKRADVLAVDAKLFRNSLRASIAFH